MKKLFFLLALSVAVFGFNLSATKSCPAFNDFYHNKNSGNIFLQKGQSYKILKKEQNSYYIVVPNAVPKKRWVDSSCFKKETFLNKIGNTLKSLSGFTFSKKEQSSLDSILVLTWHNSFCENHNNRKECKLDGGIYKNHLALHGLWPQKRSYCNVDSKIIALDKAKRWRALPPLHLTPQIKELLTLYMPGSLSYLQRHEYYKHGSCYSSDPNEYFHDALLLTKQADETIGEFLRQNIGKKVTLAKLKIVAAKLIDPKIKNKIATFCKGPILEEIRISLKGKGDNLKKLLDGAKPIHSRCTTFIIDAPGLFKRKKRFFY